MVMIIFKQYQHNLLFRINGINELDRNLDFKQITKKINYYFTYWTYDWLINGSHVSTAVAYILFMYFCCIYGVSPCTTYSILSFWVFEWYLERIKQAVLLILANCWSSEADYSWLTTAIIHKAKRPNTILFIWIFVTIK
jgi:hypothetical protein